MKLREADFLVNCLVPLVASGMTWWYAARFWCSHSDPAKRKLGRRVALFSCIAFFAGLIVLMTYVVYPFLG